MLFPGPAIQFMIISRCRHAWPRCSWRDAFMGAAGDEHSVDKPRISQGFVIGRLYLKVSRARLDYSYRLSR
jgi:hypothetical protein